MAGRRRDQFRERSGGEETEMMRGRREREEVKECYERESEKLKECNVGGGERVGEGPALT